MSLQKDLDELTTSGIISPEIAERITDFYRKKEGQGQNRLFIVFGIIGAILVGLGIVLIIAHNWDELSSFTRTAIAFLPLLAGQAACAYVLLKKSDSRAWREGSAVYLFFSIAACISLISQIYNIPGDLGGFLLTWCLLGLPVVYLMKSSVASLLYLTGITWFAYDAGYGYDSDTSAQYYWLLLLLISPFYHRLIRSSPHSNFATYHHFFIPLSIIICLGIVAMEEEILLFVAYASLFGLLYLVGNLPLFSTLNRRNNGYLVLGSLGMVGLLLTFTFEWMWEWLANEQIVRAGLFSSPVFYVAVILCLGGLALLLRHWKQHFEAGLVLLEGSFLMFVLLFFVGTTSPVVAMLLMNLLVLGVGIQIIRKGVKQDHLGVVNYGLMVVSALILCRFFDTNITFVLRGLLFILVGAGFFAANYMFLRRRKAHEA